MRAWRLQWMLLVLAPIFAVGADGELTVTAALAMVLALGNLGQAWMNIRSRQKQDGAEEAKLSVIVGRLNEDLRKLDTAMDKLDGLPSAVDQVKNSLEKLSSIPTTVQKLEWRLEQLERSVNDRPTRLELERHLDARFATHFRDRPT